MNLRTKLLLAQAPLALAAVVVGVLAIHAFNSLADHTGAILQDNQRTILAMQKTQDALGQLEVSLLDGVLAGRVSPAALEETLGRMEVQVRLQEGNVTEPGEGDATRDLRVSQDAVAQSITALAGRPLGPEWTDAYRATAEPALVRLNRAIGTILDINQDALLRKSTAAQRTASSMRETMLLSFLVLVLVGVFSSASWTRRLLRPLQNLATAARSLGDKDFNARAPVQGNDEIAQLTREFNTMADHLNAFQRSTLGELLQAQGSAQAAIDSLPDPIITFDAGGKVVNVNAAAESVLKVGMDSSNPLGSVEPLVREAVERIREHVLTGKGPYIPKGFEESVRVTTGGVDRSLLPRAAPVHDGKANVVGATLVLQDVTKLRRFDELKNNLVATVAHEFRTPLTSLRMAVHLCLEGVVGELNEKQRELLHTARMDCERLQAMVDDLLDLSRIEGGALTISPRPVAPDDLMNTMTAPHEAAAAAKGLTLTVETSPVRSAVAVDMDRVALVFDNLLGNAVRHTSQGGTITVRALDAGPMVRFEVRDTGVGIDPAYAEKVFEKFFRVPGQTSQGAGFGLFIAREVVHAHGGTMGVESALGAGSTFWFTLPVAGSPAALPEGSV